MLGISTLNCTNNIGCLGASFACDSNYAIGIGWLHASFAGNVDSIFLLGVSITIDNIVQFCNAITSRYIDKQLFCTISNRSCYRDLDVVTIPYKLFIISYTYAFKLLVLRLYVGLNFLCRLLINMICIVVPANFYLNTLETINSSILQDYFDVAKLVNITL